MGKRPGVSWGVHEVSARPRRRWLRRAIAPVVIAALVAVGVFVVIPHFQNKHYQEELAAANALAAQGPVEEAIAKYKWIEGEAKGAAAAEAAARERGKIEPYAAGAAELKRRADDAFHRKEYEAALKLYRETAEKYPLSRNAGDARAEVPQCLKRACDVIVGQAVAAAGEKRWTAAQACYDRILALDAAHAGAKAGLQAADAKIAEWHHLLDAAEAAEKSGDWSGAVALYEQIHELAADAPGAYEGRCRALSRVPPPPGMTLIPPGEFEVGDESDPPVSKAATNGYYMDVTEVSNAQYAKFVAETGHPPPPNWGGKKPSERILDLPAVCVNWDDAAAYAQWAGKRLPTGAEWERAARGPTGRKYPWGDSFARADGAFEREASPVGRMPADKSAEGCMDMGGNVCEWAADDVPTPPAIPMPPPTPGRQTNDVTPYKSVRGASWAGLESDRSERVVPVGFAAASSDPAETVLVDKAGVRGIEVRAFVETEFFFKGSLEGVPVMRIRKWNPQTRKYVADARTVRPGERIASEPPSPGARAAMDTGCRLVRVEDVGDLSKARIVYVDSDEHEHVMWLSRRAESEGPKTPEAPAGSREGKAFAALLNELSWRPLADGARSAHRLCAPRDARYVNCGFRCAKDAP